MHFRVDKTPFLEALQRAFVAVPARSTFVVFLNFKLTLEGNTLEIVAANMDTVVRVSLPVEGLQDGTIIVSAKKLLSSVQKQDDFPLELKVTDYLVRLSSSASSYVGNFTGYDASEFSELPFPAEESSRKFTISGAELQFLEEKTSFACSKDVTRIELNGILCEHTDGWLSMVATDGHRLGYAQIEHIGENWDQGVIITPKTLQLLLRCITPDTQVEVSFDGTYVGFTADGLQVVARLCEGPYPKYRNVIPTEFSREAVLDTGRLIKVVDRVSATANSRTFLVKMEFVGNELSLSSRSQEDGNDSREAIGAEYKGDEGFRLGFNAEYLLGILKMCPSDRIRLKMTSPVGACIIEPIGEGLDFFFLLMPLRLSEDS